MSELLTIKDLTHLFKVHRATIYRWIKSDQFPQPSVKKRGTYRWDADVINNEIKKVVAIGSK